MKSCHAMYTRWIIKQQQGRQRKQKLEEQIANPNIKASAISKELVTGYKGHYNQVVKRLLDVSLASVLFFCLLPIYAVVAGAIFLEDGRPILYRAARGGYRGRAFRICKFRTMIKNADKLGGGTTALGDKRITKVGNLLRKTKVDEFSNLFNIIIGQMSFIGPRPELLRYTKKYKGTEKSILNVRPGITDYSSLEFINLDEIVGQGNADQKYEKYVLPRKNKLRVKYAATVSFLTDCRLFALTVAKVLRKAYGFLLNGQHR